MKESEINQLATDGIFRKGVIRGSLEETHISWVILSRQHAFKIKKPVRLSFVDFSTLQLRKKFCEKELKLNRRYSDIYQDVVPIRLVNERWHIGEGSGRIADYAVQMKRLVTAKRMDNLLRRKKVARFNIQTLARVVASFHKGAEKIYIPFDSDSARSTFNDIGVIRGFVLTHLGMSYARIIDRSIQWSNNFLRLHATRIQQRINLGFKRDVHGDLHSGNIFLYHSPILFDCIEFNDGYRQIDLLYELAFLCMDLEAFHERRLAKVFLSAYAQKFKCFEIREDKEIFIYFKCLRANVRAKVHAMSATQLHDQQKISEHVYETKKYLSLIKSYMNHRSTADLS